MLTKDSLILLLEPFFDQRSSRFAGFPESHTAAAAAWAAAAASWSTAVTPPSTAYLAAEAAFRQALSAALPLGRRSALREAWQALVVPLAAGMGPGWVATPPLLPLDLEPVFSIGEQGGSNRDCLNALAAAVLAWMQTGTAVQAGSSLTINWT